MNEFQHRTRKQEWILAVVKPLRDFAKVGPLTALVAMSGMRRASSLPQSDA